MKEYKAFSLVELIVGITISMILMAGVGVFVSGGINNIVQQDKIIKNTSDFRNFSKDSLGIFSRIDTRLKPKVISSTSAIVKTNKNFDKLGFSFIGVENKTGYYCTGAGVDSTITKHVVIKNFLPFEEIGEDIFNDFIKTLSGKSGNFRSFYRTHIVTDNSLNILVGKKGIFGYKIGENGTGTLLNNPSGLAYDSSKKLLYIADTGNNRVLVYNNNNSSSDYKKVFKLLDSKDGLNEPTGLSLSGSNVLFIANSGNGDILEYSSKSTSRKLNLDFRINKNINNLKNFSIKIFTGVTDISKPDTTSQFSLNGISKKSPDYLTGVNDTLTYWLTNFGDNFSTQSNKTCSNNYTKYYESGGDIIKEEIQNCNSSTGTLKKYKSSNYQNISSGTNIKISTSVDFDGTDFSKNQSYYLKLTLSGSSNYYEKYFPFFINGDNDLLTRNDNSLKIISNDFKYPTGIKYNSSSKKLEINDFWTRKNCSIDLDGTNKSCTGLSYFDFSKIQDYNYFDYILKSPIKKLKLEYDSTKKYFSLLLKYYKQYNCYDSDQKIERTLILNKSFK